jgi:DnaD/phage-associated family protein
LSGLGEHEAAAETNLPEALGRAVARGVLLEAHVETSHGPESYYFINSPKGRAALRAVQSGQWRPAAAGEAPAPAPRETPNVFRLYEENIGPLTPLLAETLGEAEDAYPADWIEDAIRIAVQNNKRTWRYVAAILDRWQREGRYGKQEKPQDRSDSPEARRKYVEGDYSEFIEH